MNLKNKNGKILNVLLSIISLFVIIFIIIWIVNKNNNRANYDTVFSENLNNMQETAKEYFVNDLPEKTNDEVKLTLNQMINQGISDELTYGNTVCNKTESYISIIKISNNEYKVTSNLVCGDKSDNIIEKIKSNTTIEDEDGSTIVDDADDKDIELNITKNEESKTSKVSCSGRQCPVLTIVDTNCNTVYEYEYIKRSANCADGYTYSGGRCIKTTDETTEATSSTSEVNALINKGETTKVYTDPIVNKTNGKYTCTSGNLAGAYCYEYKDKTSTSTTSCPDGYTQKDGACYKYTDLVTNSTTSCPDGYTQKDGACYKYTDLVTNSTTSCPDGYTQKDGACYKYTDLKSSTSYSCSSDYKKDGSTCYKYTNASVGYTKWGNPTKTYTTTSKQSTYEYAFQKRVLAGVTTKGKITYYTYSIYNRSSYYYCNSGTLSGKYCYHSKTATATTSTYCPDGYTKSGNTCYMKTDLVTNKSTSCPSGYTKSGNTCYMKTDLVTNKSTSCPSGYTKSGNTCYIKTGLVTNKSTSCPSGYTDNGTNCYKKTNATYVNGTTTYSCPSGYTKTGTGSNTKCYKNVKSSDKYYCENENATLVGAKCVIESSKTNCIDGYTYNTNDGLCHKTTNEYSNVSYKIVDTVYSTETSLAGYQKTGRAKYTVTCTPIEITK